ncbi:hypothetical protein FTUN_8465 [Frigoriglobus tundricola]|uniref:YceK/YidQ family lipoprotein n=1 Tax=Frigoriglobus tundricola TaxID=2774151 RepID=A0A6M5Z4W3_9BACT|nr:hypothetical protein FTUN_8465 [Frigoriglobus tundricola]
MSFRVVSAALLLSSVPIVGCGTVANVARSRPEEGGRVPFGGVKQDMVCIRKAANGDLGFRAHPKSDAEQYPQLALMCFCAVDLPFSVIGDILTWPYTVSFTLINEPVPTPLMGPSSAPVPGAVLIPAQGSVFAPGVTPAPGSGETRPMIPPAVPLPQPRPANLP